MNLKEQDNLFRESLEQHKSEPSVKGWSDIEKLLDQDQNRASRFKIFIKRYSYAASVVLLLSLGWGVFKFRAAEPVYGYINGEPIRDIEVVKYELNSALALLEKGRKSALEPIDKLTNAEERVKELLDIK